MDEWKRKLEQLKMQREQRVAGISSRSSPASSQVSRTHATTIPSNTSTNLAAPSVSVSNTPGRPEAADRSGISQRDAILQRTAGWTANRTTSVSRGSTVPQVGTTPQTTPSSSSQHSDKRRTVSFRVSFGGGGGDKKEKKADKSAAEMSISGPTNVIHERHIDSSEAQSIKKTLSQASNPDTTTTTAAPPASSSPQAAVLSRVQKDWSLQKTVPLKSALKHNLPSTPPPTVPQPHSAAAVPNKTPVPQLNREERRRSRIKSIRQSRMIVNNQLSQILGEISKLERQVTATEAARQKAEECLIDIAVAKMELDERVSTALEKMSDLITIMNNTKNTQFSASLASIRNGLSAENPSAPSVCDSDSPSFAAVPTPPSPPIEPTSSTYSATRRVTPAPVTMRTQTADLLDQIRQGAKLRRVDVDRLKQEQKDKRKKCRQSVMMVRSLEDTIRSALQTKFAFDDDDDDEGIWDL